MRPPTDSNIAVEVVAVAAADAGMHILQKIAVAIRFVDGFVDHPNFRHMVAADLWLVDVQFLHLMLV